MGTDVTAQGLFEELRSQPWQVMRVDMMVREMGEHPLVLPSAPFALPTFPGQALVDYSQLRISLSALKHSPPPKSLPIDLSPLAELCRRQADAIADEGEYWVHPYFYLELLAREGVVKPVFWAHRLFPLYELDPATAHAIIRGDEDLAEGYRARWEETWQHRAAAWLEHRLIIPDRDEPWLEHLVCREPQKPSGRWRAPGPNVDLDTATRILKKKGVLGVLEYREDPGAVTSADGSDCPVDTAPRRAVTPFSQRLQFNYLPYYHYDEAQAQVLWHMKLELWKTSTFNLVPLTPSNDREWRAHLQRFAIGYRRQGLEYDRSVRFRKFVGEQLLSSGGQTSDTEIVKAAYRQGLYPIRLGAAACYESDSDPDLLNAGRKRVREIRILLEKDRKIPKLRRRQ